ncbi:MAG: hypothetical protein ABIQ55_01720 [Gemmatimonadaceae bacterium]
MRSADVVDCLPVRQKLTKDEGTFSMTDAAGKVTNGSFVMKDGKGCFTPAGGKMMCWKNDAPGADGSWSATADDGTKSTVMKKAS